MQTGIRANENIFDFFEQCKLCRVRFGKIVINNEQMCINFHLGPSGDWRADWRKCLPESIDSYEPCFLLFRFDSSHDWILISFADDKAATRDKMLLAATKASFKSDFGQSYIRSEYQISNRNDLILENFEKRYLDKNSTTDSVLDDQRPLSYVERELQGVAKERMANPFATHASQTLRGVQFPIDQDAAERITAFGRGEIDYVQLSIDTLNEAIKLEESRESLDLAELNVLIGKQKPRYTLFRFKAINSHPVFFIYSIPPSQSCTIKELMLFSSCKSPFLSEVQGDLGVKIDKKIEVDSREKLDADTLSSYITPETISANVQFDRPPRPGGGPRRIIKPIQP